MVDTFLQMGKLYYGALGRTSTDHILGRKVDKA